MSERPVMMIAAVQRERKERKKRPFDKADSLTPRWPAQHRKTGAKTLQFR